MCNIIISLYILGLEVPSYKLPFEAEVGAHATTEQIKTIVVMRKTRPLFPDIWKATNPVRKHFVGFYLSLNHTFII